MAVTTRGAFGSASATDGWSGLRSQNGTVGPCEPEQRGVLGVQQRADEALRRPAGQAAGQLRAAVDDDRLGLSRVRDKVGVVGHHHLYKVIGLQARVDGVDGPGPHQGARGEVHPYAVMFAGGDDHQPQGPSRPCRDG